MTEHKFKVIPVNDTPTCLGRLQHACYYWYGSTDRDIPLRVLGSYCITFILQGVGTYRDAHGLRYHLSPGDLILSFPDVGVRFAPPMGSSWYEIYVKFDGPIFDCLRRQGILDPARPILQLKSPEPWLTKLQTILAAPHESDAARVLQISGFVGLLIEMVTTGRVDHVRAEPADWLALACAKLQNEVGVPLDLQMVAHECGMSHESFRKRFRALSGQTPAQYRTHWRLEVAKSLLRETALHCREVAATVGYASEYHFSRKFKAATGQSPGRFRRVTKS